MAKAGDSESGTPRYLEVLATVRERIGNGTYRGKLPTGKALAEELGVSQGTVEHALTILKDDGTLSAQRGRGTFINWRVLDSDERMST